MDFNEYQELANETRIYPEEYMLVYPAMGLAGEAGEVVEKVKKWIRDKHIEPGDVHKELGDVIWYCAAICADLQRMYGEQYSLENAAFGNIVKLRSRMERGKLSGSGDNR